MKNSKTFLVAIIICLLAMFGGEAEAFEQLSIDYSNLDDIIVTVRVEKGDTLLEIAKEFAIPLPVVHGDNKRVIGHNPNKIKPGQILEVHSRPWHWKRPGHNVYRDKPNATVRKALVRLGLPLELEPKINEAFKQKSYELIRLERGTRLSMMFGNGRIRHNTVVEHDKTETEKYQVEHEGMIYIVYRPLVCSNWSVIIDGKVPEPKKPDTPGDDKPKGETPPDDKPKKPDTPGDDKPKGETPPDDRPKKPDTPGDDKPKGETPPDDKPKPEVFIPQTLEVTKVIQECRAYQNDANVDLGVWGEKTSHGCWASTQYLHGFTKCGSEYVWFAGTYANGGRSESEFNDYRSDLWGAGLQAGLARNWSTEDDTRRNNWTILGRIVWAEETGRNNTGYSMHQHDLLGGLYGSVKRQVSSKTHVTADAEGWWQIWTEKESSDPRDKSFSDKTNARVTVGAVYDYSKSTELRFALGPECQGWRGTDGACGLYFKPIEVVHEFYTKDSKATTADGKEETHRTGVKLKIGLYGHIFNGTLTPGMVVGLSFGDAARITWSERQAKRVEAFEGENPLVSTVATGEAKRTNK